MSNYNRFNALNYVIAGPSLALAATLAATLYTVSKKLVGYTKPMAIILSILNGFSQFFHCFSLLVWNTVY